MNKYTFSLGLRFAAAALPMILASAVALAQTPTYSVLTNFGVQPGEGKYPNQPVVFDHAGHLFGIANYDVFELTQKPDGYWSKKVIATFPVGNNLVGPLVVDANGHLYGVTGGYQKKGTVFELSTSSVGSWKKTTIHTFQDNAEGYSPSTGVIIDNEGNLYGSTYLGGQHDQGTIYELSSQQDGSWTDTVLYPFSDDPSTIGLTLDQAGNLYGTTIIPAHLCEGSIFSLTKPATKGGSWSYTTLHTFPGVDADNNPPTSDADCARGSVTLDAKGNIYGTAMIGGPNRSGAIYEIPVGGGADGPDKLIYSFTEADPTGNLVFDANGNLYGLSDRGGRYYRRGGIQGGRIFELSPQKDGSWAAKVVHDFGGRTYKGVKGADGWEPMGGLTIGPDGNFYGVTQFGGYIPGQEQGAGTAFKFVAH